MSAEDIHHDDSKALQALQDHLVRTLAEHGIVCHYPKGAIIITEGDPSDSLYVILSGRVKVYLGDGRRPRGRTRRPRTRKLRG
jgi:CRP-like cAMP-binding protein